MKSVEFKDWLMGLQRRDQGRRRFAVGRSANSRHLQVLLGGKSPIKPWQGAGRSRGPLGRGSRHTSALMLRGKRSTLNRGKG